MKNVFFAAVLFAVVLSGCNERLADIPVVSGESVELTLSVPSASTKIAGNPSSENAVGNLQIMVFNSQGMLEAYKRADGDEITLTCTSGEKRIAAFVNAGLLEPVGNESGLAGLVSDLADNGQGRLVMSGDTSVVLDASCRIQLEVSRMAARICIGKIENAMALSQHKTMKFEVKSVYLVNVPGDNAFFGTALPTKWYNMSGAQAGAPSFLKDEVKGATVSYGGSYDGKHYFYSYPNDVSADSSSEIWCPRKTRLVVEVALDDVIYYYPVTLAKVERNTVYSYELRITRPGSVSPDIPVDDSVVGVSVVVKEWKELPVIHENI